MGDLFYKE